MYTYGTEYGFCTQTASVWQLVGYLLFIIKIVIPIALIVVGVVLLGKAVISNDDKEIKQSIGSLIKKFLVAVLIFFLPVIVSTLFGVVNGFKILKDDYMVCSKCVSSPYSDYCTSKVSISESDMNYGQ